MKNSTVPAMVLALGMILIGKAAAAEELPQYSNPVRATCTTELNYVLATGANQYKEGESLNLIVGKGEQSVNFEDAKITASVSQMCDDHLIGCHPQSLVVEITAGSNKAMLSEALNWESKSLSTKGHNVYLTVGPTAYHVLCFIGR